MKFFKNGGLVGIGEKKTSFFFYQVLPLFSVLAIAIILDAIAIPRFSHDYPHASEVIGHISIALYVAFFLGILYEIMKEKLFEKRMDDIVSRLYIEMRQLCDAVGTLTPKEIFDLLRDVASAPNLIPTLYKPARSESEYNFVEDNKYFDRLIPAGRPALIESLRSWLQHGNHRNVKFLASDFIGKYQLSELKDMLFNQAKPKLDNWSELPAAEKDWVLNYYWAASRCETPMYNSLAKLLQTTPFEEIQQWILFVPLQMPDKEFIKILDNYLSSGHNLSEKCMTLTIRGLAALHKNGYSTLVVFRKHRTLYSDPKLIEEICRIWRSEQIDPSNVLRIVDSHGYHER